MVWRQWLIRLLVFSVLGALVLGAALFVLYTDPARVRQLVQDKLGVKLVRVGVQLDSARFRLLGGVQVNELRLSRADGLDRSDFLYVPSAVIFHDKEHLLSGKVLVRRLELHRPQVRVVRLRDGRFNLSGLFAPGDEQGRLPTTVVRGGTVVFEDQQLAPGTNLLEIRNVNLTILNDPLPTIQVEGSGTCDVLGPVRLKATIGRDTHVVRLSLDVPDVPVGPALVARIGVVAPEAGRHLERLTGRGKVQATAELGPDAPRCEVKASLVGGSFTHALLPSPLERIEVQARLTDGAVPEAKLAATFEGAKIEARLADLPLPRARHDLDKLHQAMRELDLSVQRLPVTPLLLDRLPTPLKFFKDDFSPAGPLTLTYTFRRCTHGPHRQEVLLRAEGMTGCYRGFPYPVERISGTLRADLARLPHQDVLIDLAGYTGDRPVTVRGRLTGEKQTTEAAIDIEGRDVPLDGRLFTALPPRAKRVAGQFLPDDSRRLGLDRCPMGRGDVVAHIRRLPSGNYANTIRATLKDARVRYDEFPYPLENVSGKLVIYPDHWEAIGFHGTHDGGAIRAEGRSYRLPDRPVGSGADSGPPERVKMSVEGTNLRLGPELEQALAPAGGETRNSRPAGNRKAMQKSWRGLALTGRCDFSAVVVDDPGQTPDVDCRVVLRQCTMRPGFFSYLLEDVAGAVRFAQGRVFIDKFTARHGDGRIGLRWGLLQPQADGRLLAWLDGLSASGLRIDEDLLRAMPPGLSRAARTLRLGPTVDLGTSLTLDIAPGAGAPVKVWWDAGLAVQDAQMRAGVNFDGVTGRFHTRGHFDGRHLGGVSAQVALKSARAFNQPLTDVTARIEVPARSPEVLRVRDLKASIHGGTLGGEANLTLGSVLKYDVLLDVVGMNLQAIGQHNMPGASGQRMEGLARAAISLQGEGDDLLGLKGSGRVDVVNGKIGELPMLLDLFKALGLRKPDRTAFEQAHAEMKVEGPRLHVSSLDLWGNAVSLRGAGSVDLDGNNVNLDFTATFGRLDEWLPLGLDRLPRWFSSQLLKIKMRGRIGPPNQVRFEKDLVPGVFDPIRRVLGAN